MIHNLNFKNHGRLIAALVFLGGVLALMVTPTNEIVAAVIQRVMVVNTTAEPVPTAAQGTTAIAGTVQAQQSGLWNVGVTGTVGINNSTSSPVPVRDVDHLAKRPFHASASVVATDEFTANVFFRPPVPDGMLLVIEYVSAQGSAVPGDICNFAISTELEGTRVFHRLAAIPEGTTGVSFFRVGNTVRLFAGPGTTVVGEVSRLSPIVRTFDFTISGYLVECAATGCPIP